MTLRGRQVADDAERSRVVGRGTQAQRLVTRADIHRPRPRHASVIVGTGLPVAAIATVAAAPRHRPRPPARQRFLERGPGQHDRRRRYRHEKLGALLDSGLAHPGHAAPRVQGRARRQAHHDAAHGAPSRGLQCSIPAPRASVRQGMRGRSSDAPVPVIRHGPRPTTTFQIPDPKPQTPGPRPHTPDPRPPTPDPIPGSPALLLTRARARPSYALAPPRPRRRRHRPPARPGAGSLAARPAAAWLRRAPGRRRPRRDVRRAGREGRRRLRPGRGRTHPCHDRPHRRSHPGRGGPR